MCCSCVTMSGDGRLRRFRTTLKDQCNQKLKCSPLLTVMPMESQIKFRNRANISAAKRFCSIQQQVDGDLFQNVNKTKTGKWLHAAHPVQSTFLCKDFISALLKARFFL